MSQRMFSATITLIQTIDFPLDENQLTGLGLDPDRLPDLLDPEQTIRLIDMADPYHTPGSGQTKIAASIAELDAEVD